MTLRHSPVPLTLAVTGALALGLTGAAGAVAQPKAKPSTVPEGSSYVALGDSFSSGTGTRASTDPDCYRSPYGYPRLVADAHGLLLDYQACSGAVIADVHANQVQALSPDTDYVTMTIGGNDVGFASVITECALPGWLSNCEGKINDSRALLQTEMPRRYDTLFTEVGQRAPGAEVVIGGYPLLFNGTDCNLGTFFSPEEMASLNSATGELDSLIQQRTEAAGFRYVDPRASFKGHAVCDDPEWINGLSSPIVESYHPNREGNVGYADVFWPGTSGAKSARSALSAAEPRTSSAAEIRAEADAVLAMDLTSTHNLDRAQAEGVSTGEIKRAVAQLRSSDTAVVKAGLATLNSLEQEHTAG